MSGSNGWEMQLADGDPTLLHELDCLNDPRGHFWVWGGVDYQNDCRSDHFSFNSAYLDDISGDEHMAWQVAHELLSLFNGAVALFMKNAYPFRLLAVLHNGDNTSYVEKQTPVGLLGPLAPKPGRPKDLGSSASIFRVLALACEYPDAYLIIKILDQKEGWVSYYKILETVEAYSSKYHLDIPVDKDSHRSFKLTANNFSISGLDSRHGFKEQIKEIKTPAMSLESAYDFITSYIRAYLVARYGNSLSQLPAAV